MSERTDVVFVLADLGLGGAQRVATLLSGAWAETGFRTTVATLAPPATSDHYAVPTGVSRVRLGPAVERGGVIGIAGKWLTRVRALRRLVADEQPSAVIAFVDGAN